jgi:hypothetical protein
LPTSPQSPKLPTSDSWRLSFPSPGLVFLLL